VQSAPELLREAVNLAKAEQYAESVRVLETLLGLFLSDELKKAALTQISICLMRLREYGKAENYLLKCLEINRDSEALELLAELYDLMNDNEKALLVYTEISKTDSKNIKAKIKLITLKNRSNEEDYFEVLSYMDSFIAEGGLAAYSEINLDAAFSVAFESAKRLYDIDKALSYFDAYHAALPEKLREKSETYREFLIAAFSLTIYSDYHTNERQIQMMRVLYKLSAPARENTFIPVKPAFGGINIGFLSSDLCFHPVGRFLLSLFMENIINSGINYFCYDTNTRKSDTLTEMLKQNAHKYAVITDMRDDEAENLILADKLDVLFDLNGISQGNRRNLIAKRLAPVQLTWIGFPCSSAIRNADYVIVDCTTDPAGISEKFYTEKLAYMQKTFLCYPLIHGLGGPAFNISPSPFVKNGYITFGSFNNAFKFTGTTLKIWAEILKRVSGSKLIIRSDNGTRDDIAISALKRRFSRYFEDMSRVCFLPPNKIMSEYLRFYDDVDIILDTFPFNGATTTCDAFIMGVPIVSMYGEKHVERVGLSMLNNVGLGDLAAATAEEFIETAAALAQNPERLIDLRQNLREMFRKSPLADTASFKIEFENLMRKLYIKHLMENKNPEIAKEKETMALIFEILRGLYFLENMFYTEADGNVVTYVKSKLSVMQRELYNRTAKRFAEGADKSVLLKYRKYVGLFERCSDFNELRNISKTGTALYKMLC